MFPASLSLSGRPTCRGRARWLNDPSGRSGLALQPLEERLRFARRPQPRRNGKGLPQLAKDAHRLGALAQSIIATHQALIELLGKIIRIDSLKVHANRRREILLTFQLLSSAADREDEFASQALSHPHRPRRIVLLREKGVSI